MFLSFMVGQDLGICRWEDDYEVEDVYEYNCLLVVGDVTQEVLE